MLAAASLFNWFVFQNAVELLASHPKVSPGGVGVVGVSKGAELAHLVAIISHKVRNHKWRRVNK